MKRIFVAGGVAIVASGSFLAMAATLGGLTAESLGADSSVIASCDTDGVTSAYTLAYDATDARTEVVATVIGGVDAACAGQNLTVTLTDGSDVQLDSTTVVAVTGSNTVTTTVAPEAESVVNVHVVISG